MSCFYLYSLVGNGTQQPHWSQNLASLCPGKVLSWAACDRKFCLSLPPSLSLFRASSHDQIALHTHTQRQREGDRETERDICDWCSSNGKSHRICYHLLHVLMYENKGYQWVTDSCCATAHWNTGLWRNLYVCLHVCLCVGECVSKISERDFSLPLSK